MTQVKHAHWNVKGPQSQPLHELFDEQAAMLADHADIVAERATALGGYAMGTARMSAAESRLSEYPDDIVDGLDCVAELADRFGQHGAQLRGDIETAMEADDEDTADLYIDLSREIDKQLWFLESHLHDGNSVEDTGTTDSVND